MTVHFIGAGPGAPDLIELDHLPEGLLEGLHRAVVIPQDQLVLAQGDEVRELKFTPDGKLLASRCVNPDRKGWALWNVSTGELVLRLPVPPSDN